MARTNPPFMTGVPELLLLRLLSQREMYGYELVRQIQLVTGEAIKLGEGVIYPSLYALERAGALKATKRKVGARDRIYYKTTRQGKQRLKQLESDWIRISDAIASSAGLIDEIA
ncbi:MAG: PadR family transcriptional regulator [Pseudomonadota bacterium]